MASLSAVTNQTDTQDTALQATYAGAKRRIATLEQELQTLHESGSKRKSDAISNVTQGRAVCRLVSMFETVDDIVSESDRRRSLEVDTEDEDDEPEPPTDDQARTFRAYKLLTHHITSIEKKLIEMETHQLGVYFRDLRKGSGGARGDDAANLKPCVNPNPPLSPTTKTDRGFEHDVTGRLLCPMDYDWDDTIVRQNIRDGHPDFVVTGDSWPAFLYPNAKGDPADVEKGLLRSAILVKAFKFIFTSPTSAQDIDCEDDVENAVPPPKRARNHKAPTRGHIANLLGMKTVTPRSIAYIAVQLRFSMSNASAWNENDGCFSYVIFYNNIVDFFEMTPGPKSQRQAQELLSWWTSKIFGRRISNNQSAGIHAASSVSKLASQRAARELVPAVPIL